MSSTLYSAVPTVCRACMAESHDMRPIFCDSGGQKSKLSQMIYFVTDICIYENDELPKHLCTNCILDVQNAALFKEKCQKSNAFFKEVMEKDTECIDKNVNNVEVENVKAEPHIEESEGEMKGHCVQCTQTFSTPQEEKEHQILHANPYQCSICSNRFATPKSLQEHLQLSHKKKEKPFNLKFEEIVKKSPGKYKCPHCNGADFKHKRRFALHVKSCMSKPLVTKHLPIKQEQEEEDNDDIFDDVSCDFLDHKDSDMDTDVDDDKALCNLAMDTTESKPAKEINCLECQLSFKTDRAYRIHRNKNHPIPGEDLIKTEDNNHTVNGLKKVTGSDTDVSLMDMFDDRLDSADDEITLDTFKLRMKSCEPCGSNFKNEKAYKIHCTRVHRKNSPRKKSMKMVRKKFAKIVKKELCPACSGQEWASDQPCSCSASEESSNPLATYGCTLCERKFNKKESLVTHLKKHEDQEKESHTCDICKREFKRRAHLNNHMLTHTSDQILSCGMCPKTFDQAEALGLHLANHKGQKKHQCNFCEKGFNMLSTLKDHIRTHTGEKPFLCSICGRGFSQITNLKEHMRRHQGYKPFKCDSCDLSFVSKGELVAHSRKHSGAHPFVCDLCGGGFTTSSSLVKHRRIHTGERPYACDFCPMRFTALGTLKNHRRTHTGEKPYKCNFCTKAFAQKNDLVSHTRTHTGERPYVCATCGQAFRQSSALKTHLKMHAFKEQGNAIASTMTDKIPMKVSNFDTHILAASVSSVSCDSSAAMAPTPHSVQDVSYSQ